MFAAEIFPHSDYKCTLLTSLLLTVISFLETAALLHYVTKTWTVIGCFMRWSSSVFLPEWSVTMTLQTCKVLCFQEQRILPAVLLQSSRAAVSCISDHILPLCVLRLSSPFCKVKCRFRLSCGICKTLNVQSPCSFTVLVFNETICDNMVC